MRRSLHSFLERAEPMKIGVQLYTLRQMLDDDFEGVLGKLAETGCHAVEFAWKFGGKPPEELARFMEKVGLEVCGFHLKEGESQDPTSMAFEYALALNAPFVTLSQANAVAGDWPGAIERVRRAATIASDKGLGFSYHHHAEEFAEIGGKTALDILAEELDEGLVQLELDTYWIRKGGEGPVARLRHHAGRVPQLHAKDMAADGAFAPVGTGEIDFPAVLAAAKTAGVKWVIVEQDVCQGPPLECVRTSVKNLRGIISSRKERQMKDVDG